MLKEQINTLMPENLKDPKKLNIGRKHTSGRKEGNC